VDIKAPAPAGLAVAAILRKQFDDEALLFISVLKDEQTVRQAAAMGAIAYLVKPQDMRQIIPTIETALARAADLHRLRQSQTQLSSVVEQNRTTGAAVGILVERLRLDRQEAFETLRRHARSHRRSVSEVAEQLLSSAENVNTLARSKMQPRHR
jgi:response regulator NasT